MVRSLEALLALVALNCVTMASGHLALRSRIPAAKRVSSHDVISSHVLTLKRNNNVAKSARYLRSMRSSLSNTSYGDEHVNNLLSEEYIAEIEWAGVPVEVIVDTGSSDTWLVQEGFTCVDVDGNEQPEADCYFGPVFNGTFDEGSIADENFNITYGDGEFLTGVLGYENVTVAGVTADHQQVALVTYAYWEGDSVTSGLMGLAYPLLTSAFNGTNPEADSLETQVEYNSIITTMIAEGLIEPVFSLALDRNSDSGYLALGGLPPVNYTDSFVTTPILMIEVYDEPEMATQYSFYTIIPDGIVYNGSEARHNHINTKSWSQAFAPDRVNAAQTPYIVDSGTTLLYLPTELYEDIAVLYDPPAVYIEEEGASFAACNATVPSLGVQINGTVFDISADDMLMQSVSISLGDGSTYCLIGPQDGEAGPYILGDTFMNNVISVFDVGASEMRFAEHVY